MIAETLVDIIKVGTLTIIVSKATKAIGQKDMADIISGVGILAVGIDIVILITPVCRFIARIGNKASDATQGLNQIGLFLGKILHMGG